MTEPNAQAALRPQYASGPSSRGVPLDLGFVLQALRRQARLIGLVTCCGLLLTFLALLLATPRYTATASILLDTRQQRVFNADTVLPGLSDDMYVVESQLEILRSPRIANRVIRDLRSRGVMPGREPARSRWAWRDSGFGVSKVAQVAHANLAPPPAHTDDASPPVAEQPITSETVVKLLRDLVIERKGRSYIVEVSYTSDNPERAASIANAFVDAYMADQLDGKFHATRNANLWLKERMQEIAREQDVSEHMQQLIAARAHAAEAEARLGQVDNLPQHPTQLLAMDVALQSTVIGDYRRQAADIQRRIVENTNRLGEQHPSVAAGRVQLEVVHREVVQEARRIVENRKAALEEANAKVRLLDGALRRLSVGVTRVDDLQVKLAEFKREATVSNELYSSLLRRYKETRAQEKLQTADARIVSNAVAPPQPTYPKKSLVLMLSSVAWLGLGAGLALARELRHRTYRTRDEVEAALGVECVAAVPVVDLGGLEGEEVTSHNLSGPIYWPVSDNQIGDFSQAIFSLRKWIETCGGRGARIVLVVAANRSDGCSTIAVQLAQYAATTGTRTVLLDADLRSRGLSDVLGVAAETSFPDAILSGTDPYAAIVNVTDSQMRFCSSKGDGRWRPLDVLGARATGKFLSSLRDEYDLIVVDTPPLSTFVDAHALVEHADCALIVVKAGQTHHNDVAEIMMRLCTDTQLPIGVVLNMARLPDRA